MYTLTPANVESTHTFSLNAFLDYPEQNFAGAFGARRLTYNVYLSSNKTGSDPKEIVNVEPFFFAYARIRLY